jgi:hypothetical protein
MAILPHQFSTSPRKARSSRPQPTTRPTGTIKGKAAAMAISFGAVTTGAAADGGAELDSQRGRSRSHLAEPLRVSDGKMPRRTVVAAGGDIPGLRAAADARATVQLLQGPFAVVLRRIGGVGWPLGELSERRPDASDIPISKHAVQSAMASIVFASRRTITRTAAPSCTRACSRYRYSTLRRSAGGSSERIPTVLSP